ncbi:hypothetical protein ACQKHW_10300, partial [Staphylococcus hominis]
MSSGVRREALSPEPAARALRRTRILVEPVLRQTVDRLPASLAAVASYHLGWLDTSGAETTAVSGKGLRPALTLLSAEVVGGDATRAVRAAVVVSLIRLLGNLKRKTILCML